MEPVKAEMKIVIVAPVQRIEERFIDRYLGGIGKEAQFEKISLGYFIQLEGSWESSFVGYEQPNIKVGDRVKITLEGPYD